MSEAEGLDRAEHELRDFLEQEYGIDTAGQDQVIRTIAAAVINAAQQVRNEPDLTMFKVLDPGGFDPDIPQSAYHSSILPYGLNPDGSVRYERDVKTREEDGMEDTV